jgi:hypothetical protein
MPQTSRSSNIGIQERGLSKLVGGLSEGTAGLHSSLTTNTQAEAPDTHLLVHVYTCYDEYKRMHAHVCAAAAPDARDELMDV